MSDIFICGGKHKSSTLNPYPAVMISNAFLMAGSSLLNTFFKRICCISRKTKQNSKNKNYDPSLVSSERSVPPPIGLSLGWTDWKLTLDRVKKRFNETSGQNPFFINLDSQSYRYCDSTSQISSPNYCQDLELRENLFKQASPQAAGSLPFLSAPVSIFSLLLTWQKQGSSPQFSMWRAVVSPISDLNEESLPWPCVFEHRIPY